MLFDIATPPAIEQALRLGAAVVVSISGGKDSQSIIKAVAAHRTQHGWTGPLFAIHAHLGRAEWRESLLMCRKLAAEHHLELVVVRRASGDLFDQIVTRMRQKAGDGQPFWPSSAARYCTSDQKRGPIEKKLREFPLVISVEGIRAEESPARRKKPVAEVRGRITMKKLKGVNLDDTVRSWEPAAGRLALNWYPIHGWSEAEVYEYADHSLDERDERRALYRAGKVAQALDGWAMHPAYVYGNDRVSCNLCVLAGGGDLRVGARHNPAAFHFLRGLEVQSGFSFKNGWSLEQVEKVAGKFPCPVCGAEAVFSYSETHWQTNCPACLTVYSVPGERSGWEVFMVRNNLKAVVNGLTPGKDKHYRRHARQSGVGWQQFSGMLHNKTRRVSLRNLQRIRNYLSALTDSITPGPITINLGDMMQARGLTQSQTAAGAGIGYVTVNRLVNSNVEYLDYNVIGKLCRFLAVAPDELVDTGGLLVLARD